MENIDSFVIALQRSVRKMNSQTLRSGRLRTRAKLWGVEARRAGGGLPRSAPPLPRGPDPAEPRLTPVVAEGQRFPDFSHRLP